MKKKLKVLKGAAFLFLKYYRTFPDLFIYIIASQVKHHPNIFSVTVFMYSFLQKNNTFVKYCYPSIFWSVKPVRMPFGTFDKIIQCPLHTDLNFEGIPIKVS